MYVHVSSFCPYGPSHTIGLHWHYYLLFLVPTYIDLHYYNYIALPSKILRTVLLLAPVLCVRS